MIKQLLEPILQEAAVSWDGLNAEVKRNSPRICRKGVILKQQFVSLQNSYPPTGRISPTQS
jgi:hypothetical protein